MHRYRKVAALCITITLLVTLASTLTTLTPASAAKTTGATAYWAEAPSSPPNFICLVAMIIVS